MAPPSKGKGIPGKLDSVQMASLALSDNSGHHIGKPFLVGRSQTWCLLTVVSLIFLPGTTRCFLRSHRDVNLEAKMNISEMITYWGYPSEDYEAMTEDGYILGVYGVPYGKNHTNSSAQRPVVFLQHGLLTSASSWISNLPSNSLAFLLADMECYVWLGNSRGNTWSRRHSFLSVDSDQFWPFSFDEMATYDLLATIDFIGRKTGQKEMYYIGHSQGTTVAFVTLSTLPRLAQRIQIFFALAPVITIQHTKSLLIKVAYALKKLLRSMPPVYNVTDTHVPTAAWNGGQDLVADPEDVKNLLPQILNLIYHKTIPYYNHLDFIWGIDAPWAIYYKITNLIKKAL